MTAAQARPAHLSGPAKCPLVTYRVADTCCTEDHNPKLSRLPARQERVPAGHVAKPIQQPVADNDVGYNRGCQENRGDARAVNDFPHLEGLIEGTSASSDLAPPFTSDAP